MASSIMSPTEAAIAPNDMILMVMPTRCNTKNEKATVTGMVRITTRLERHERRKRMMTIMASNRPS